MISSERRQHRRRKIQIGVTIRKDGEEIPATMVDISNGGIGITCEQGLFPGTAVQIPFSYRDDFAVQGDAKWTAAATRNDRTYYRIGIKADDILMVAGADARQSRVAEFVKKMLSDAITSSKQNDQGLRADEQRQRLALEGAGMGLWDHDLVTGEIVWCPRTCELLGLIPNETETTVENFFARMHAADRRRVHKHLRKIFKSGSDQFKDEFRIARQDGEIRWIEASGRLQRDNAGRPIRMSGVDCDITERKRVENAVKESEVKFRSLFENLRESAAIYEPVYDEQGKIIDAILRDANPTWLTGIAAGMSREEVLGKRLSEILGPETLLPYMEWATDLLKTGEAREFETLFVPLDRYYLVSLFPVGKDLVASAAIDVTDIKKSEAALRTARDELETRVRERTAELNKRADQLARMSSELTLTEERERRRLAEKLHDHLQQLIVGAKINLESLSSAVDPDRRQIFEKVMELLAESLQATRQLTAELSPPILAQGNLSAALKWLAEWVRENQDMTVELQIDPDIKLERTDLAVLLFRAVRELLFNVIKHAGVRSARIEAVLEKGNWLHITVSDRGKGFDVDTFWLNLNRSFGLLSVRERLTLMGGRLKVESSPGRGASFALIVPLD